MPNTFAWQLEAERLAASDDSWKGEYDERLNSWRAENAERRAQSEKTRGEWEQRRSSKEYVESYTTPTTTGSSMASSFVDARDLVSGEHQGGHGIEALNVSSFVSFPEQECDERLY